MPSDKGRDLPAYQHRQWVRERKEFWVELRKRLGRGEREEFEIFCKWLDIFTRGAKIV